MNNLRFNLLFAILSCVILAVCLGIGVMLDCPVWLLATDMTALVVSACLIWKLAMGVMQQTRTFVKALEMKDFTLRFPETFDREMNSIHNSMNRIIALYRDGTNALETRKLYYDRILRIMTHELRNSITPIVSLAEDMDRHPERYHGDNLSEALSVIATESSEIKHFLDSYYELTHLPKPEKKMVDAAEFFSQIRKLVDIKIRERKQSGVTLNFIVASGMKMEIDPVLMRRVFVNLLTNAFRAVEDVENPEITVSASMPEGRPFITVSDNGCGMSAHTLENLFQPFFTTRPDGNGIGLCLSRQIVRLHEGDIYVSSTPGHGSSFRITFA